MTALTVTVPGTLKGKARPRITRAGHAYTPSATVSAEAWVKHCAVEQVGHPCLDGALRLQIAIAFGVPASWSKKKRAAALAGELHPTGKPDIDNLAKLAGDSLNGILWRDDSQIVVLEARKFYASEPFTVLTVQPA